MVSDFWAPLLIYIFYFDIGKNSLGTTNIKSTLTSVSDQIETDDMINEF